MILSKIADTWLGSSTTKVNHYGIPISTSRENKTLQPYTPNPVRTGEAESRLLTAYVGPEGIAELRNRSVSIDTHKYIYRKLLTHDDVANITRLVPRETFGYPGDKPVQILTEILRQGAIGLEYKEDLNDITEDSE
jgi:hypothetical protein